MRRALILQHSPVDGPGLLADVLRAKGVAFRVARLDLGEPIREAIDEGEDHAMLGVHEGLESVPGIAHQILNQSSSHLEFLVISQPTSSRVRVDVSEIDGTDGTKP